MKTRLPVRSVLFKHPRALPSIVVGDHTRTEGAAVVFFLVRATQRYRVATVLFGRVSTTTHTPVPHTATNIPPPSRAQPPKHRRELHAIEQYIGINLHRNVLYSLLRICGCTFVLPPAPLAALLLNNAGGGGCLHFALATMATSRYLSGVGALLNASISACIDLHAN